jgi:hypothetical protein
MVTGSSAAGPVYGRRVGMQCRRDCERRGWSLRRHCQLDTGLVVGARGRRPTGWLVSLLVLQSDLPGRWERLLKTLNKHVGTLSLVLLALTQLPRVDTFLTGVAFFGVIYDGLTTYKEWRGRLVARHSEHAQ